MKSIKLFLLAVVVMLVSMGSAQYVPPSAPLPSSPTFNKLSTNLTPTLVWQAAQPVLGTTIKTYEVKVALSSNFSYGVVSSGLVSAPNTSFKLSAGDLMPARTYYWKVRAKNNLNEWGPWSGAAQFRTSIGKPAGLVPADNSTPATTSNLLRLRPKFSWNKVTSAQSYQVDISTDCGFNSLLGSVVTKTNAYTPNIDLPADTWLCWRVRANNSTYGPSAWSVTHSFFTANPPSVALLQAPTDNTLTNDYSPELVWGMVNLPAATTFSHYEVQIANTSNFKTTAPNYFRSIVVNSINTPSYQIPDENNPPSDELPGGYTYYWRVRSFNSDGHYSTWSTPRILKITVDRPENLVVTPNPPIDPRPLFDWENIYHAEAFRIEISTSPLFVSDDDIHTTIAATTKVSQYRPFEDLPRGVTLYWRVKSIDGHSKYGESLFSDASNFLSANPPTTPYLTSPANNAIINDATPKFSWSNVVTQPGTTFSHYQLRIAQNNKFTIGLRTLNNILAQSKTISNPLQRGKTYYWSVRACNTDGHCSSWAPYSVFKLP